MSHCKICGKQIVFVKVKNGRSMPCETKLQKYYRGHGQKIVTLKGDVLDCAFAGPESELEGLGYIPHWGNCSIKEKQKKPMPKEDSLF